MFNWKTLTFICASVLSSAVAHAEPVKLLSPDRSHVAILNEHGEGKEAVIDIATASDPTLFVAEKDMRSADGEHGRTIERRAWSPNSEYFVVSTSSSGGHSPWKYAFIFYRKYDNRFISLYDLRVVQNAGSIVSEEIVFKNGGDTLEVQIGDAEGNSSPLLISLAEAGTED